MLGATYSRADPDVVSLAKLLEQASVAHEEPAVDRRTLAPIFYNMALAISSSEEAATAFIDLVVAAVPRHD